MSLRKTKCVWSECIVYHLEREMRIVGICYLERQNVCCRNMAFGKTNAYSRNISIKKRRIACGQNM